MLRYVIGIVSGFTGAGVIWVGLFLASFGILDTHGDRTVTAWYQIKQEVAGTKSGAKKIVFVGGSNVLYGISAAEVEQAFGMPCLNFGTHAGLPFDYLLHRVKQVVSPGDILVISLEWEYLHRPLDDLNAVYTGCILGGEPRYFWRLPASQQLRICFSAPVSRLVLPLTISPEASAGVQNVYMDSVRGVHIDSWGDFMGNFPERRAKSELARLLGLTPHPCTLAEAEGHSDFWKVVRELRNWAKRKRVTVVFAAPALLDNPILTGADYRQIFAAGEKHYESLGIPVIARQNTNFYGESLMFDSVYHLNSAGREIRTKQLIEGLKPVVSRGSTPK